MYSSANPYVRYKIELEIARFKGSRYLGMSLFWKHLEKIPPKHVFRPASVEYRSIKLMFIETILIVIAVVLFTVSASMQFTGSVDFASVSQTDFWTESAGSVSNVSSLWTWLDGTLTQRVFSTDLSFPNTSVATTPPEGWLSLTTNQSLTYTSSTGLFSVSGRTPSSTWTAHLVGGRPFKELVMLGPVRLRQVRVTQGPDCGSDCYLEDKKMQRLQGTPSSIATAYIWQPSNVTNQGQLQGAWSSYPGSGYVHEFPLSMSDAIAQLEALREWSWIDGGTRAIIVEVSTINSRAGVVANVLILFEVNANGKVKATPITTPIKVPTRNADTLFVLHLTTCAAFTAFSLFLVNLVCLTWTDFFSYFWNVFDISLVVMYFLSLGRLLSEPTASVPSILSPVFSPLYSFMPFSTYFPYIADTRTFWGVTCVMVWLRLIKPLALVSVFRTAVKVTERSIKRISIILIPFVGILCILAAGFMAVFDSADRFTAFPSSFYSLAFIFSHSVDISDLDFSSAPAIVLLILYLVFMYLLLPGVTFSCIFVTYTEYVQELEDAKTLIAQDRIAQIPPGVDAQDSWHKDPVMAFLYTWFHKVKGVDLIHEPDEDVGFPEEQEIELRLLPKAIQNAWTAKRSELLEMIESKMNLRKSDRKTSIFGERLSKLVSHLSRTQTSLLKQRRNVDMKSHALKRSTDITQITRIQLQRLLDSDEKLAKLLLEEVDEDGKIRPYNPSISGILADEPIRRIRALDLIRKYSAKHSVSRQMMLDSLLSSSSMLGRDRNAPRSVRRGLIDMVMHLESSWKEQMSQLMETVADISKDLLVLGTKKNVFLVNS